LVGFKLLGFGLSSERNLYITTFKLGSRDRLYFIIVFYFRYNANRVINSY